MGARAAGHSAAAEAARDGAAVTLLEREDGPMPPRSKWPDIIQGHGGSSAFQGRELVVSGVEVAYGVNACSVSRGCRVSTSKGTPSFDAVVVATGSRTVPGTVHDSGKDGVHVLDSLVGCAGLAERLEAVERLVVFGGGLPALRVAGALVGDGRTAVVITPRGYLDPRLNPEIVSALCGRASSMGIVFLCAGNVRAVGNRSVEAVVADGRVVGCDELAVVPDVVPTYPESRFDAGPGGGILVNSRLETSVSGCFAAGSCAEMRRTRDSPPLSLRNSASLSGRVAGANAAGRFIDYRGFGSFEASLLGIEVVCAGMSLGEARSAGVDAAESAVRVDESACSVVYDLERRGFARRTGPGR